MIRLEQAMNALELYIKQEPHVTKRRIITDFCPADVEGCPHIADVGYAACRKCWNGEAPESPTDGCHYCGNRREGIEGGDSYLTYKGGRTWVCCCEDSHYDTGFYFNYCPMCGRHLGDSIND